MEEAISGQSVQPIDNEIQGFYMLYSSGTTGRPKGVKVNWEEKPYGELDPDIQMTMALFNLDENAVYLSPATLPRCSFGICTDDFRGWRNSGCHGKI